MVCERSEVGSGEAFLSFQANCTVSPVYPIPEMKIFRIHKTDKEERHPFEDATVESEELEGRVHRVRTFPERI